MATPIPVSVVPVVLAEDYCPTSWQILNLAIMSAKWSVDLGNVSTFIIGPTAPDEALYPDSIWIKTDSHGAPERAYKWSGGASVTDPLNKWISPHRIPPSSKEVKWFTGSVEDIAKYEGGTAGTATIDSGPFWELVPELAGRVPIGVNDATTGGPDETLPQYALGAINTGTVDDPLGTIRLTDYRTLPQHSHPMGLNERDVLGSNLVAVPSESSDATIESLFEITGGIVNIAPEYNPLERQTTQPPATPMTAVNTYTLDVVQGRHTARVVESFDNRVPVLALHPIRRTIRAYYAEL